MKANDFLIAMTVAGMMAVGTGKGGVVAGTSTPIAVPIDGSMDVNGHAEVGVWPSATILLDGNVWLSSDDIKTFDWQPQTKGVHQLTCQVNGATVTSKTVRVKSLAFAVQKAPNPPTAEDPKLSITPSTRNFGAEGGAGLILVSGNGTWTARVSNSWITLNETNGAAGYPVAYLVAATTNAENRQGYVYVGGYVHTVTQDGLGATISPESATVESVGRTGTITVRPPDQTSWQARANVDWVNVSPVSGSGAGTVTFTVAPLNEVSSRQGTLTVGGQTFTVFQYGQKIKISQIKGEYDYLPHKISIKVDALPSTVWTVKPRVNWISVVDEDEETGNDSVTLAIEENPSWETRIGMVDIGMKTFTVTQWGRIAALSTLSKNGYEFSALGESCEVKVSVADIVEWQIEDKIPWLTVSGSTNRVGPGTVTLQAALNDTGKERSGLLTIAGRSFKVLQKARGVEVEYETKVFGAAGGSATFAVHPVWQMEWKAESSDKSWITVFGGEGTGDGEVLYLVSPYEGTGTMRTGSISVGDKVVRIMQRAYDLSIDPAGAVVPENNGVGEFGVSASIGYVWTAIVTEPWITIVEGYDKGTGSGTVRFLYTDNDTGKMRTGKIIVAGEVYTLTQKARELVEIAAVAEHGGTVEGAGTYDLGTKVTLTAVPGSGYEFSHWTGDVESMENPLVFNADVPKSFTAVFAPLPIAFESVVSGTNGVTFAWNNLAWATHYLLYRGVTSVPSSATLLADIPNTGDCTFLDDTGELEVEYWYWIEAEGVEDDVMGDPMTGKKKWGWPDAKDEAEVAAALAEAEDARLKERIGSVGEYDAFRAWSAEEGREEKDVRDSEHAWSSYALGAEGLFENEPQIQIAGFAPDEAAARRRAAGFAWEIRVTVKDGENAASVDADKLAALFEATRQIGDWTEPSLLPLSVTAKGTDGDTLLFEVTLEGEDQPGAFLRLGE